MSDFCDRASEREQEMLADAMAAHARKGSDFWPVDDGEHLLCRVCDDFIPEARRLVLPGVQTCIDCQAELELATKTRGVSA
ncbi:TraR/DksA C4-type zinc finger protein [Propionivibrio sp.]|uniref:TraR/DksA C4-type zinc finger protein n=1 Tax=Propionivibrio sp. TaxID=2212460 RepID=UPI003BF01E75